MSNRFKAPESPIKAFTRMRKHLVESSFTKGENEATIWTYTPPPIEEIWLQPFRDIYVDLNGRIHPRINPTPGIYYFDGQIFYKKRRARS